MSQGGIPRTVNLTHSVGSDYPPRRPPYPESLLFPYWTFRRNSKRALCAFSWEFYFALVLIRANCLCAFTQVREFYFASCANLLDFGEFKFTILQEPANWDSPFCKKRWPQAYHFRLAPTGHVNWSVITRPGHGENLLRFCFAKKDPDLDEACARLRQL